MFVITKIITIFHENPIIYMEILLRLIIYRIRNMKEIGKSVARKKYRTVF